MTRVVCDFLHHASRARSRNRMRQSLAKVVPSNSALKMVADTMAWTCLIHSGFQLLSSVNRLQFLSHHGEFVTIITVKDEALSCTKCTNSFEWYFVLMNRSCTHLVV